MSEQNAMSRRQFVAGASGLVLAGAAAGAEKTASNKASKLAINGGEKAVVVQPQPGTAGGLVETGHHVGSFRPMTHRRFPGTVAHLVAIAGEQYWPLVTGTAKDDDGAHLRRGAHRCGGANARSGPKGILQVSLEGDGGYKLNR